MSEATQVQMEPKVEGVKKEEVKTEEPKLSAAELKKRAKAEKQARRAAQKGEQQSGADGAAAGGAPNGVNGDSAAAKSGGAAIQLQQKPRAEKQQKGQQQQKLGKQAPQSTESHHKRTGSQQIHLPDRTVAAQSGGQRVSKKKDSKQVELFSHLYTQPRRTTIEGTSKDVHPAVLALGLQMSSYEICGSTARCVAMLLAFKEAIKEYTTPAGTSLARHLTSHYLSPQIDYLRLCRAISESMGNAIRWLKKLIVEIDPSTPEQEAKDELCERIDTFIHERIIVTDQAISTLAAKQIKNGSVVLTYAKSSIVEKTILEAHSGGARFRVMVVDSRPLFEGKSLATSLMNAGVEVEYLSFSAISYAVKQATVVLMGAHSMLSNGCLQSRIGTASVAMQAAHWDIPVIVCCESVKFSGKVALDSVVHNEIAPAEELVPPNTIEKAVISTEQDSSDTDVESKTKQLGDWKGIPNLQLLNLMYDVTPAEYIRAVICEYGSLPPSSVPVVHRLANEAN